MTDTLLFIEAFHFVRPLFLVLFPVVVLMWWRIRQNTSRDVPNQDGIAPHLRTALTVGAHARRRVQPIDGVCLTLVLLVLGAAGPTWSREPDPFMAQIAPVVVVLEVSGSMDATDIQPSRLERAKQKIRDFLDLRAGARTALVAYSGSAHRVVPLTEDAKIMLPYLEGLSSDIMPEDGANATDAFEIALGILAGQDTPGGVLFVLDGLNTADNAVAAQSDGVSIAFLSMLPAGQRDVGLDAITQTPVVAVSPDNADVRKLDHALNAAFRRALLEDESQQWHDRGWWLIWPAALLTLVWFRRGWTMQWELVAMVAVSLSVPTPSKADGLRDWFFTSDQQGRLAYGRKDYEGASALFQDPLWKGYAMFRNGNYEQAAEVLGRLDTAEASFIQGISFIRNRNYRDGIDAFEVTLGRDPDYPGAAQNLELALRILDYVEETREQSDTGEQGGIGADDVVFDNEAGRGADTTIEAVQDQAPEILSTEQWMNTVNTQTSDFLRLRFLMEAK